MELSLYQITDIINGLNSNIIASQAIFLTIVSAYLLVAYSVGRELTKYQAGFVSLIFFMFMVIDYFSAYALIEDVYEYHQEKLAMLDEQIPNKAVNDFIFGIFLSIRLVITLGSLIFMWQVRRSKRPIGVS